MVTYDEMSVEERTSLVDSLLLARQSVRQFKMDPIPPQAVIEAIIWAGIQSPSSVRNLLGLEKDWRRFVAIRHDSPVIPKINQIIVEKMKSDMPAFLGRLEADPNAADILKVVGPLMRARLQRQEEVGAAAAWSGIGNAPWLVIMGERRSFPSTSLEPGQVGGDRGALFQAMMAMWLKSSAMGLGFQMVSATSGMTDNEEFCDLIGLPAHTYVFDSCALGWPDTEDTGPRVPKNQPTPNEITDWIA